MHTLTSNQQQIINKKNTNLTGTIALNHHLKDNSHDNQNYIFHVKHHTSLLLYLSNNILLCT